MKRTLAVLNRKGGAGKTTLSVNLAACLARSSSMTLIDADPQGSAAAWLGEAVVRVADPAALSRAVAQAASELVVIDGPPFDVSINRAAFGLADLVLIPVGPSPLDVDAARPIIEACLAQKKPFLAVLTLVNPSSGAQERIREVLEALGARVARTEIARRQAHAEAVAARLSVIDYAPSSLAADEIRALAREVATLIRRIEA